MGRSRARRRGQEVRTVPKIISALDLVDVVYPMTILAGHPRSIDRYIDYFGSGGGPRSRGAEPGTDTATEAVSRPDAMSPNALHPTKGFLASEGGGGA